jgi:Spy/CpxP family protein refolding chaperone
VSGSDPVVVPPAPPRATGTMVVAAIVVVIAFLGGIFIGVAGDRFYLIRAREFFPHHAGPFVTDHMVRHLQRELNLSPQQSEQVRRILETSRGRIDALFANVRPQVKQEIDQASAQIEKVLTREQRTKFEALRMRMMKRWPPRR